MAMQSLSQGFNKEIRDALYKPLKMYAFFSWVLRLLDIGRKRGGQAEKITGPAPAAPTPVVEPNLNISDALKNDLCVKRLNYPLNQHHVMLV